MIGKLSGILLIYGSFPGKTAKPCRLSPTRLGFALHRAAIENRKFLGSKGYTEQQRPTKQKPHQFVHRINHLSFSDLFNNGQVAAEFLKGFTAS